MDLSEMRTRVRKDLHDDNALRWSDGELDRHIGHALREVGLAVPLEAKVPLTTVAGSRELSLSSLADLVGVEAVEYPAGRYPPSYVRFSVWAGVLTLLVDAAPGSGEAVNVYYGKLHTLDASTSTLPSALEDLLAIGAAAYAAIEWASYATNRVNLGGEATWRNYLVWGQDRLAAFARGLARQARKNIVRCRQLYTPSDPPAAQGSGVGG
ncbi:MAG: hypothetical protein HYX92_20475 [Chloroflexi bacterium]|nr:hypothetical protein [Chloroflexota bacterium]